VSSALVRSVAARGKKIETVIPEYPESAPTDTNGAIVFLQDRAANPKSQSAATLLLSSGEWTEQSRFHLLRNAHAIVGYGEPTYHSAQPASKTLDSVSPALYFCGGYSLKGNVTLKRRT